MQPSPPISTFLRTETATSMTVTDIQREKALNIDELLKGVADLHPTVDNALQRNRALSQNTSSNGSLPKFSTGDWVVVARDDFTAGEKLALRWRRPRRVVRASKDYTYEVEDIRTDDTDDVHVSRLKFYSDDDLDKKTLRLHIVQSETGMVVHRLRKIVDTDNGLMVEVR